MHNFLELETRLVLGQIDVKSPQDDKHRFGRLQTVGARRAMLLLGCYRSTTLQQHYILICDRGGMALSCCDEDDQNCLRSNGSSDASLSLSKVLLDQGQRHNIIGGGSARLCCAIFAADTGGTAYVCINAVYMCDA